MVWVSFWGDENVLELTLCSTLEPVEACGHQDFSIKTNVSGRLWSQAIFAGCKVGSAELFLKLKVIILGMKLNSILGKRCASVYSTKYNTVTPGGKANQPESRGGS